MSLPVFVHVLDLDLDNFKADDFKLLVFWEGSRDSHYNVIRFVLNENRLDSLTLSLAHEVNQLQNRKKRFLNDSWALFSQSILFH